jgi:hypothetical protein
VLEAVLQGRLHVLDATGRHRVSTLDGQIIEFQFPKRTVLYVTTETVSGISKDASA